MSGLATRKVLAVTLVLSSVVALGACRREAPPAPSSGPAASAQPPQSAESKARVLRLLAGGEVATALPLVDVSEGKTFDPELRDRIAPLVTVPYPKLRVGEVKVVGDLPDMVVRRVMRQNFGRFRLCYEEGLARKDDLKGEVILEFTINPAGTPQMSKASGTLEDRAVIDCVGKGLREVAFPERPSGNVKVTFPIQFSKE